MREIVHLQAGQCGNQIGAKVSNDFNMYNLLECFLTKNPTIDAILFIEHLSCKIYGVD